MTQTLLNSAVVLLQSEYPGLTPELLKAALDSAGEGAGADLTVKETCLLLKRSKKSIYRDVNAGRLEMYKVGHSTRVRRSSVNRLINGEV